MRPTANAGVSRKTGARTALARSLDPRFALASALALSAFASAGCGGSPTAPRQDEVFYLHGGGVINKDESWEVYFKPLDAQETPRVPRIVGVGVLKGDVRLGRPIDWYIRSANNTPEQRHISYQSPRQFIFSIYERIDHPEDSWDDVLDRYEDDLEEQGATIVSGRVPIATANTQGRSYLVKTTVPGKPPYQAFAHEVLIRSDRRILLVQIVHSQSAEAGADEMVAALKSMIVY
jgi:hypothetical protein